VFTFCHPIRTMQDSLASLSPCYFHGFTLIELLVVIGIIELLVAILLRNLHLLGQRREQKDEWHYGIAEQRFDHEGFRRPDNDNHVRRKALAR
jgi:hypothetical protein